MTATRLGLGPPTETGESIEVETGVLIEAEVSVEVGMTDEAGRVADPVTVVAI